MHLRFTLPSALQANRRLCSTGPRLAGRAPLPQPLCVIKVDACSASSKDELRFHILSCASARSLEVFREPPAPLPIRASSSLADSSPSMLSLDTCHSQCGPGTGMVGIRLSAPPDLQTEICILPASLGGSYACPSSRSPAPKILTSSTWSGLGAVGGT